MLQVIFTNQHKSIFVEAGTPILEAARRAGVTVESPCNGNGTCGKCTVRVSAAKHAATASGETVLSCQYKIDDDIIIFVRDYADENRTLQIVSGGNAFIYEHNPFITKIARNGKTEVYGSGNLLGIEEGDTTEAVYGLAVDIGTTTLVAALVDLHSGKILDSESALNPQAVFAQDVLGRIYFASQEGGLTTLYQAFTGALESMISALCQKTGVRRKHIYEAVYSGNTTMLHLALETDPQSLGQFPYTVKIAGGSHVSAERLGISPFGLIWLPPVISAWVGADITSGILATRLAERKGVTLFIDIGTNGEMALAKNGEMAVSSTAAGPAFEGMNICCGMRASRGAIESFSIDEGTFSFEVIGIDAAFEASSPAITGICGSGLLDIAGELVRTGIVGKNGRFVNPATAGPTGGLLARSLRPHEGKTAFFITDEVYVSQKDIRQIQLAKGAIRCGIEMLLARVGLTAADVEAVQIAGSFGYHLNEASLLGIGLLPVEFAGKVAFVGNTSMTGGVAFLLNTGFRSQMIEVAAKVDKVELANDKDFERTFIKYMGF